MAAALGLFNDALDVTQGLSMEQNVTSRLWYRSGSNDFLECIEKRGMRPSLAVASGLHPSSLI